MSNLFLSISDNSVSITPSTSAAASAKFASHIDLVVIEEIRDDCESLGKVIARVYYFTIYNTAQMKISFEISLYTPR